MRCKTEHQCGNREVRSQVQKAEVQRWRHAMTFSVLDMACGSIMHLQGGCRSWQTVQFLWRGTKRERSRICCIRGWIESGGSWECRCLLEAHEGRAHSLTHAMTGKRAESVAQQAARRGRGERAPTGDAFDMRSGAWNSTKTSPRLSRKPQKVFGPSKMWPATLDAACATSPS